MSRKTYSLSQLHGVGENGYASLARNALMAGLDVELLTRFVERTDQPQAIKEHRDALRTSA